MDTMTAWWSTLQPLNQWFYVAAAVCSVFFLWQLIAAIAGLSGGHDVDSSAEPSWEHQTTHDAADSVATFRLLSVRSVIAFFTLFSWGGALYLNQHIPAGRAVLYALVWGLAAMVLVSLTFHLLRRMAATGDMQIATCVGQTGTVYLDIPVGGDGEVRLLCSGIMTHFKARLTNSAAAKAGTKVRIVRVTGANSLEVELIP